MQAPLAAAIAQVAAANAFGHFGRHGGASSGVRGSSRREATVEDAGSTFMRSEDSLSAVDDASSPGVVPVCALSVVDELVEPVQSGGEEDEERDHEAGGLSRSEPGQEVVPTDRGDAHLGIVTTACAKQDDGLQRTVGKQ